MTCELEPTGASVKLTIIHEMEKSDSRFIETVSNGWPLILASLKSLLETGEPLEETCQRLFRCTSGPADLDALQDNPATTDLCPTVHA